MSNYDGDAKYDEIVKLAIAGAAIAGPAVFIAPMADLIIVGKHWATMAVEIARLNDVKLEKEAAGKVMTAVAIGVGAYVGAVKIFNFVITKIPGIGTAAGIGVNSGVNVALTLWLAFALIDLFSQDGEKKRLEDYAEFLIRELKPRMNTEKIKRSIAFVKRVTKRK